MVKRPGSIRHMTLGEWMLWGEGGGGGGVSSLAEQRSHLECLE